MYSLHPLKRWHRVGSYSTDEVIDGHESEVRPGSQSRYSMEQELKCSSVKKALFLPLQHSRGVRELECQNCLKASNNNRDSQGLAGPGAHQVLPHSLLLSYLQASSFHRGRFSGNAAPTLP